MARSNEFNREMGEYLRRRRTVQRINPFFAARSYFSNLFNREQKTPPPEDVPPEQVQAVLEQSKVKPTRPARVQPQPARTAPKKVKSMGWFNKKKDDDFEEMAPAQPALDEDVKEVLKITFKWLKQMDPEQIEQIKRSPDFEKYKQVLDKYGLIKK